MDKQKAIIAKWVRDNYQYLAKSFYKNLKVLLKIYKNLKILLKIGLNEQKWGLTFLNLLV